MRDKIVEALGTTVVSEEKLAAIVALAYLRPGDTVRVDLTVIRKP